MVRRLPRPGRGQPRTAVSGDVLELISTPKGRVRIMHPTRCRPVRVTVSGYGRAARRESIRRPRQVPGLAGLQLIRSHVRWRARIHGGESTARPRDPG
jgi:hypothetical protein